MLARRLSILCLVLLLVLSVRSARAEFGGVPDKWLFSLGGTATDFSTSAALTTTNTGTGAVINFEDLFGVPENKSAFRFTGTWRFSEKGYLDFGYVEFNRAGERVLVDDVVWGEFTILQGALVGGAFDAAFPYAAYRHDFLQEDKVKISGSAGISYLELAPSVATDGTVIGPSGPVVGRFDKGVSIQFPVPLVGLQLDWALRDRLLVQMYTRFFYLNYASIEGNVRESAARLQWYFSKHVGIGIALESNTVRLKEYETENYKAKFLYEATGLTAHVTLAF